VDGLVRREGRGWTSFAKYEAGIFRIGRSRMYSTKLCAAARCSFCLHEDFVLQVDSL